MEAHEGNIKIDFDRPPFAASADPDHSPVTAPKHIMHRERDSLDDFEHLDRDMDRSPAKEAAEPGGVRPATPEEAAFGTPERIMPAGAGEGVRSLQAFLDTEREELVVEPALLPAPLMPEPAPPQPRPEPPAPPVLREPSPSHHEAVYSDSREDLSEEELERPPPHVAPYPAPAPAPPLARAAPPPVPVTPAAPTPTPVPAPVPKVAPASPARAAPGAPVPAILQELGLDALFQHPERLHPRVEALVYWRCPTRSAAALGGGLALLLALACCSLISVLAYLALLILVGTVAFRLYRNVAQAVQKTSDGHPFKELLETDLTVSPEKAQEVAVWGTAHLNASVAELRRLFLVEDLVDSLKFGVMLWCFTYVGAWFNGMTLIIIAYVAFFTVPKVYETNKTQIDANLEVVSAKFQEFTNKVRAAIPIGKKAESEKEK